MNHVTGEMITSAMFNRDVLVTTEAVTTHTNGHLGTSWYFDGQGYGNSTGYYMPYPTHAPAIQDNRNAPDLIGRRQKRTRRRRVVVPSTKTDRQIAIGSF